MAARPVTHANQVVRRSRVAQTTFVFASGADGQLVCNFSVPAEAPALQAADRVAQTPL